MRASCRALFSWFSGFAYSGSDTETFSPSNESANRSEGSVGVGSSGASAKNVLDYRHTTAEELVKEGAQFDAVCAMEVVEHVDRPSEFLRNCGKLVKVGA